MENELTNSKQKKMFGIITIVLSVISICLLGIGFYSFSNSKTVLLQSISKLTNSTKELLGEANSNLLTDILKEDKVNVSSDIIISVNDEEMMGLDFNYLENKKDKKSTFNFNLTQNETTLLETNGILANDNIYVKVKDIMDYYYVEYPYISLFEEAPVDDYKKLIDIFSKALREELNQKDIKKSKETIKLGEKDKKVTKLSYKVTSETINNIFDNASKKILKDDKLIKSLAEVLEMSDEELKKELKSTSKNSNNDKSYFYYNVYYYGFNNIVMYEISDNKDKVQFYDYDDNFEISLISNKNEIFNIELLKNKDKYDVSGKLDSYTLKGTLENNNNKLSLDLDITVEGIILNVKIDQKITEKENYKVDTDLEIGFAGTSVKLDSNLVYSKGENIKIDNLNSAKEFSSMTDSDIQTIIANIQNHPFLSSIYQLIMNYSGMLDSSNDLNYSDNYDF